MQDHIERYGVDLCAPDVDFKLASALTERGLALIDGIPDPGSLLHLVWQFAVVVPHRHSAADGVTTLVDRGTTARSGLHGFTSHALPPHTDGAGLDDPPAVLLMTCRQPATSGASACSSTAQLCTMTSPATPPRRCGRCPPPAALCSAAHMLVGDGVGFRAGHLQSARADSSGPVRSYG